MLGTNTRSDMFNQIMDKFCESQERIYHKKIKELIEKNSPKGYAIFYNGICYSKTGQDLYPTVPLSSEYQTDMDYIERSTQEWKQHKGQVGAYIRRALNLSETHADIYSLLVTQLTDLLDKKYREAAKVSEIEIPQEDIEKFKEENAEIAAFVRKRFVKNILQGRS